MAQDLQDKLKALFEPKSIAVIGASRKKESVGYAVFSNLIAGGFTGKIFPVNPKTDEIEGCPCFSSLFKISEKVDLAVVIVPAPHVPETIRQCAQKGISAAIIISAGFREVGIEGKKLEEEVIAVAKESEMIVLGPNCLGLINAGEKFRMNASFSRTMPRSGKIAFVSQSGALCTAILDYAKGQNIGFSKFVSLGNKAVMNETDILKYLQHDPETDVVLMYVEDLVNGREFIKVSREMTGESSHPKPILVIKSGRTAQGAKAASSHTGSLMGADEVYDAVFAQSGVLRVDTVQEMFDYSIAFAYAPLPQGKKIAILTNAGGPGIMATDACVRYGLELAALSEQTNKELQKVLPRTASLGNPIDVIGDAQHGRYRDALTILARDPSVDCLLVILTPQAMTDIEETAQVIVDAKRSIKIPMATCFMGIVDVSKGVKILEENKIPNYRFPEDAARSLAAMARYQDWIQRPRTQIKNFKVDRLRVDEIILRAQADGKWILPIHQAMEILEAYRFPVLPYRYAVTKEQATRFAREIGFPVVLKMVSPDIIHKFDFGAVQLNLNDEAQVASAYDEMICQVKLKAPKVLIEGFFIQTMAGKGREVILGMNQDPVFGPVLMFGLGGVYVEALKDVTFRVAPVRERSAKKMIESIRAYPILKGVRGEKPSDISAIIESLERLSQLACEQPQIQEIDINPLLVHSLKEGAHVLDARIILKSVQPTS